MMKKTGFVEEENITLLAKGVLIKGEIRVDGTVRIDGRLEGEDAVPPAKGQKQHLAGGEGDFFALGAGKERVAHRVGGVKVDLAEACSVVVLAAGV